jgi:two-component system sensor histidine kinase PilS (NtrC family)
VTPSRRSALLGLRVAIVIVLGVIAARATSSGTDLLSGIFVFAPLAAVVAAGIALAERSPNLRHFAGLGWLLGFDFVAILLVVSTLGEAARPDLLAFLLLALVAATSRDLLSGILAGLLAGSGYAYLALQHELTATPAELAARAGVYLATGAFVGLLSVEADVERAEAQARTEALQRELEDLAGYLKNVLASVASAVVAVGEGGKVTTYNRAAEKVLGFPAHRALGRALQEVPVLAPLAELLVQAPVPAQGSAASSGLLGRVAPDVEFARPDGKRIRLGFAVTPLEDVAGRKLGAILVLQDVTLIRDYEERMVRQEKLAALGRLVSGIAHEFGNVLGGARGHVDFALRDGSLEEARSSLEVVRPTLDRAITTIEHLLRFARGTPINLRPEVDVAEVVERALVLTKRELESAGVEIRRDFGPAPRIEADSSQLEQVFINIIINARQAIDGRERRVIAVSTRVEGDQVVAAFEDSGPGVPEEIRDKVFEPFFTTKGPLGGSSVPGTGLGLSVALGIIEAHGGTIDVLSSSALGGARFEVRLPSTRGDAPVKST